MKIGIYPGTFNPWHQGHSNILQKALESFDKIIIAPGINTEKGERGTDLTELEKQFASMIEFGQIKVQHYNGFLYKFVDDLKKSKKYGDAKFVIVRGLRDGYDLAYERSVQYWNEDLGLAEPVALFICDRQYGHISSSAIRAIRSVEK